MSATVAGVIVVAGALMQPQWLPSAQMRSRLPRLAQLPGLHAIDAGLPPTASALPRELSHDRWLRLQLEAVLEAGIAPGAMTAIRQVSALRGGSPGWLLEPVHFHLAKDHLVLVAGAARSLALSQAQRLIDSIAPLLEEESFDLTMLSPSSWLLKPQAPVTQAPVTQAPVTQAPVTQAAETQASGSALQLSCASSEAASGRNVEGYLPTGDDARRYRRLLNEIQMTWHEHAVNRDREMQGDLPINSVWLSGPMTAPALAAWHDASAQGRYTVDDTLLVPRLQDDRSAWLDALAAMDARLHELLVCADTPSILLCGDYGARWLQRETGQRSAWSAAIHSSVAGLAHRVRSLASGHEKAAQGRHRLQSVKPRKTASDCLVQMFTEAETDA